MSFFSGIKVIANVVLVTVDQSVTYVCFIICIQILLIIINDLHINYHPLWGILLFTCRSVGPSVVDNNGQ